MGEAKRRRGEIDQLKQRSAKINRRLEQLRRPRSAIYAIHEAGHAFGRFRTAPLMGIEVHEAVDRIEVDSPNCRRNRY
jgi:hypothetical protein